MLYHREKSTGDCTSVRQAGIWVWLAALLVGCGDANEAPPREVVLWVWQGEQDLSFLEQGSPRTADRIHAAVWIGTVRWLAEQGAPRRSTLETRSRKENLWIHPKRVTSVVVRLENATGGAVATPSLDEIERSIWSLYSAAAEVWPAAGLQLDFDAALSEREFYDLLLARIAHRARANQVALSITALASWCEEPKWLADLPVDGVVPMLFRLGSGGAAIYQLAQAGGQLQSPRCRKGIGFALDESWRNLLPLAAGGGPFYFFPGQPWSEALLQDALDWDIAR